LATFDALQKTQRLLLNKMSAINYCLCKEQLDRKIASHSNYRCSGLR